MKFGLINKLRTFTHRFISLSVTLVVIAILVSNCTTEKTEQTVQGISEVQIFPTPVKILYKRGYFKLDESTRVLLDISDEISNQAAKNIIDLVQHKTKHKLKIADRFTTIKFATAIEIIVGQDYNIKPEGFRIVISSNRIKILANDANGLYYASNVMIGLLNNNLSMWRAAQVSIEDYPKTNFRGVILNLQDSIPNKAEVVLLLTLSRINYVITTEKWANDPNSLLQIGDTSILLNHWDKNLIANNSISEFYNTISSTDEISLFSISNKAFLHPDSLLILGEAMWSSPTKLDYQKILKHIETE
jgi:glycosyl hydrolase family 20